jgi:tetratricopeptide (TPR) repeat protein
MRRLATAFTAIVLLGAATAHAQEPPPPPPPPKKPMPPERPEKPLPPDGPDGHQKELRKRIQAMRLARLTQELDLDETATAKLFPLLNRHDEKANALMEDRGKTIKQLAILLHDGKTEGFDALLDKIAEDEKTLHELDDATHKKVREILSPAQMAKFVLFHEKFHDEVRALLEDAHGEKFGPMMKHGGMPGGPGPGAPGLPPEQEKGMLEKAARLIEAGQLDDAIGITTKVLMADPQCAGAFVLRAHAHAQKAELDEALDDLKRAMKIDPDALDAQAMSAHVLLMKGRPEEAVKIASSVIERAPAKSEGWAIRGLARTQLKQWDDAIADLSRAIELNPKEAGFWRARGDARSHTDAKGAIADYEKSMELAPNAPENGHTKKRIAELQPK